MAVSVDDIKRLREVTGAGMMDAKTALEEAEGNFDRATELLRKKGVAQAAKRSERVAKAGVISSYVHGDKIGVLVEVNCETDFVARTGDFKDFAHDLALHVAAAAPEYLDPESVPAEVVKKEEGFYREELAEQQKPAEMIDKIVAGKLDKFYEGVCLMRQSFVKDPDQKIADLVAALAAKTGENIIIRRFSRLELGGQ